MNSRNLRLKTKLEWQNTQYLFNPKKNVYMNYDENVKTTLQHYWQIPLNEFQVKHSPTKVIIQQYVYRPTRSSRRVTSSLEDTINLEQATNQLSPFALNKLSELYSTLYKKPVEFKIILLKYPFLSSKILAQYLAMQTRKHNVRQIRRNLFKKGELVDGISTQYLNWTKLLRNGNNFLPTHLAGMKLRISGRMSLRKGAARSAVVTKSIGRLRSNTVDKSMTDYAKAEGKNMNGAYCIKVWLSSATV
ncbi:hypothetical protein C1645_698341 [Glomus cerebriforme]|uniref:Small ribosomal subunit protein uS3m n=1 Tax=Glomus cerebriforme TaxID=658196 RepID=A0A397SJG6_9GLOM|nr:hypothetical protein C1645_698341 [Glomus cerebriforme]